MSIASIASVMLVALPLGALHALDTDHVLAVSTLAVREKERVARRSLAFSAQWALGHGGFLMLLSVAALLFHVELPAAFPHWAERLVGMILIVTGLSVCWRLYRQRCGAAVRHAYDGKGHAPLLVGMVHGLAGSGAALALIPASLIRPAFGLAYVLTFSVGVLAGMVIFGLCLGRLQGRLAAKAPRFAELIQGLLGALATGVGVAWLAAG